MQTISISKKYNPVYQTQTEAIVTLHEQGFTQDFQPSGSGLFWVQERMCIGLNDFSIVECHGFCDKQDESKVVAVLGILLIEHNIKGILIDYSFSRISTPCLQKHDTVFLQAYTHPS